MIFNKHYGVNNGAYNSYLSLGLGFDNLSALLIMDEALEAPMLVKAALNRLDGTRLKNITQEDVLNLVLSFIKEAKKIPEEDLQSLLSETKLRKGKVVPKYDLKELYDEIVKIANN